jgi:hypothetical protein
LVAKSRTILGEEGLQLAPDMASKIRSFSGKLVKASSGKDPWIMAGRYIPLKGQKVDVNNLVS